MPAASDITVLVVDEHLSARDIADRIRKIAGPLLLVMPPGGFKQLASEEQERWFRELKSLNRDRTLILATKHGRTCSHAKAQGWQAVSSLKAFKLLAMKHPHFPEALRAFSPGFWRQQIRSQLQFIGLLSLPKIRIWTLLVTSICVFLFIFLKLLPSATIKVWPHHEADTFTANVFLLTSGAVLPVAKDRVRTLTLVPLAVQVDRTLSFDEISKDFTGTNAEVIITLINDSDERYSFRRDTRLVNQAGMVFKLKGDAIVPPHGQHDALAIAMPIDLYGEVVGERGNVPSGLKWDFLKLRDDERKLVYGRNGKPGTKGKTAYSSVLKTVDIVLAQKKLEQELLSVAKQMTEEERQTRNEENGGSLTTLNYDELTLIRYSNFVLPSEFIGHSVTSVPVQGSIDYTVLLYDEAELLQLMKDEVLQHVTEDRVIVEESLVQANLNVHVIPPWDDAFHWVKVTADISYARRFLLNPITPSGARFGKYIRDNVAGKYRSDAERIIKNLPEVSRVEIRIWPPWAHALPSIGSNIDVEEQTR